MLKDNCLPLKILVPPAKVDAREPVPDMAQDLFSKLFDDRDCISQKLLEQFYQQDLQLITKRKKNMKNCVCIDEHLEYARRCKPLQPLISTC